MKDAYLIFEDGTRFKGKFIGSYKKDSNEVCAEICFNTGNQGYQEISTDPSYFGQIVVLTMPHVDNYGFDDKFNQSKFYCSGLVVKNSTASLDAYMRVNNVPGITDIDTRGIVKHITKYGSQKCCIVKRDNCDYNKLKTLFDTTPSMEGLMLCDKVSTKNIVHNNNVLAEYKIGVIDYGCKISIINELKSRLCDVVLLPYDITYEDIKKLDLDGVLLSNGPGDPSSMKDQIKTVKQLLFDKEINIPIFGICLGHQILSLACGMVTKKMKYGHRGINQPVIHSCGSTYITSQNHGFCVQHFPLPKIATGILFRNLNDDSIEGIYLKTRNAFSVQFHPESSPGPNDTTFLFDNFLKMIDNV